MHPDGSNQTQLTFDGNAGNPSWSASNEILVDSRHRGDITISVIVSGASGIIPDLLNTDGKDSNPTWSPDGTKIAFQSDSDGEWGEWDIFVMNADGSDPINLTN